MNNISYSRLLVLPLILLTVAFLPACKKDTGAAPAITGVRNYVASPNDTFLTSLAPNGQWVVITGAHLQNAVDIEFDGVSASFNNALFSSTSAVVQIPTIVFTTIDTNQLYTIKYTTTAGTTTFPFKLGPAAPTITAISNVFANPGDSCFILGTNLVLVQHFSYGGTNITSFRSSSDGDSLSFVMPAQTTNQQVVVATKTGTATFQIVATPTITAISNENANPGDSVYVYGTYLKNIQTLTFAGTAVTSYASSADGSRVGFILPALTQPGPVSLTTPFGTATTVYNVNDVATGALANMEFNGTFGWAWWGGATLYSGNPSSGWPPYISDFPGNTSQYVALKTAKLSSGEGNTWSSYAVLISSGQWVPTAHLSDPPANWALKFEISIPSGWNGGTFDIQSGLGTYVFRWEPWQTTATTTAPYSTHGWTTVTIPLTSFRAKDATLGDGKGAPLTAITDLTGSSGSNSCTMYIHNYSASTTATGFYGAFDNIRVVQIK